MAQSIETTAGATRLSRIFAVTSLGICVAVLVGWARDNQTLKSILPGYVTMKANTAVALALLAVSALLLSIPSSRDDPAGGSARPLRVWLAWACSFLAGLVGALTTAEYALHTNFGIDELLFLDPSGTAGRFPPGRLAPITATLLMMLALGQVLISVNSERLIRLTQWLTVISFLAAFQAVVGYASNITYVFGSAFYTQMAIHTAVAFCLLCGSILLLRPEQGFMKIALGGSENARTMRVVLLSAMIVPPIVSWLEIKGQRTGLYDPDFGVLVRVMANVIFLSFIVWQRGSTLYEVDLRRKELEANATLLQKAVVAANVARDFRSAIQATLCIVCESTTWKLGHAYLVEPGPAGGQPRLVSSRIWYAALGASPEIDEFTRVSEDIVFAPGVGTPGEVYASGLPVSHRDISRSVTFQRKELMAALPMRGISAFPVFIGTEVVAVLELFCVDSSECQPLFLDLMLNIGTQLGYVLERERTAEESARLQFSERSARETSRLKSEFLANMSHEIRTPMNGVLGMTELALGTTLTAEQREYLDMVKSSAESLLTIIDDILDFSKIEAGKLTIDAVPFDLQQSIATTVKLLALRANVKGLELAFEVRPDVPTSLLGDPSRLRQIITNLMGNAIKFTERGEILLTVEAESQTAAEADLHFSVSDTGIGIPADQQEAIFKPFVQADGTTTRKYGGTGLGLAISTNLVALLGGRIWLESVVGHGSTFHFTMRFPIRQAPAATATPDSRFANLEDMPVLVIDDNALNRRILGTTLSGWRMKPVLADSGGAGLAAIQVSKTAGGAFPLVLIDGQMPGLDGFSVAEAIKNDPDLADTTLIMLTSAGRPGDGARCRELGIAAYLMKPISQSELLETILSIVQTSAGSDPPAVVTRHSLREERRKLRILLAEDNAVNQLVAARLLEKRGHAVVVVGDGHDALEALKASAGGAFDLVLMDVQMPRMDGLEAARTIRRDETSSGTARHVPIIAMTAHAMKGDEERCLAAGMDGYVSKPIEVGALFAAIDELVPAPASATVGHVQGAGAPQRAP